MSSLLGFPPSARLVKTRDFNLVFKRADSRNRHGALRLLAVANRMPTARLGLVVPKRAVRKAVERNRMKRVLRDQFRHRLRSLQAMDLVFQVMAQVDNATLRADADVLFKGLETSTGKKV